MFLLAKSLLGCLDGMQIGKRLLVVGILFLMLGIVIATQYAVTRTGYVFTVVHPSDANIRFIGSDLSGDGIRVLRAVNNGTTGTIQVSLGNFSAGCNKTYTAAFCIVNEESFVVNITHINVSTAGADYLQIWLHGERKSDVGSDSGDVAFLWNKGVQVSQSTSTAWTLGQGNNDASDMDGSGASTLWDGTSGVRYSTYNTTAVNGTDDYVWVQISLDLPQNPSEDGETGALFIHFEASTFDPGGGGAGTDGPRSPSATGDDYNSWFDPSRAFGSNDSYTHEADQNSGAGVDVDLSWDGGESYTSAQSATLTTTEQIITVGDSEDTWGRAWSDDEFSNANFRVRISDQNYQDYYNFNLEIPNGATILGIEVSVEGYIEEPSPPHTPGDDFVDHIQVKVYYST